MTHYLLVEERHEQVFDMKTKTFTELPEKVPFCEKLFTDYRDLLADIADGDSVRSDVLYAVLVDPSPQEVSVFVGIAELEEDLADYLQECRDQENHVRQESDQRNFI